MGRIRGTIPTRNQRVLLTINGYDASEWLFLKMETLSLEDGRKSSGRETPKYHRLSFMNRDSGETIYINGEIFK